MRVAAGWITLALFSLLFSSTAVAQSTPPPPPSGPAAGTGPVPGGAPAGGPPAPPASLLKCTITGSQRPETLRGTSGNDVICGKGGSDLLYGFGGRDIILGGTGNDVIFGGQGNDALDGGAGTDRINGGSGIDVAAQRTGDRFTAVESMEAPATADTARAAQQRFGEDAWRIPRVTCTGKGFVASVDTATRFGAQYGEPVWWRPIGWEYNPYTGKHVGWNATAKWDTYYSIPPDGTFLFDQATGRIVGFPGFVQTRAATLFGYYGHWLLPAIQVYTRRTGYQWDYVGATVQGFSEDYNTSWCWVPPRNPNDPL